MTDEDKALVKLLRVGDPYEVGDARHKAADRIAALEADNARLLALVKEAGEALEDAHYALLSANATILKRSGTRNEQRTNAIALCNATLAKIKDATDAD